MSIRFGRRRLAVGMLTAVAAVTATGMSVPSAASAATGSFSCLQKSALVNSNPPDQLMAGWLTMDGKPRVWIGTSGVVDWSLNPYHDEGWRRHFLSLKWLETLTRQYQLKGPSAAPYLVRAETIAADFAAKNPPNGGPAPSSAWAAMYAGQRATVYTCLDTVHPGVRTTRNAMAAMGGWLADPRNNPGDWNQGVEATIGLLGVGCRLGRDDWQGSAVSRLGQLATTTIDPDGAIVEQAPGYASFLYNRLTVAREKIVECGHQPSAALTTAPAKLLEFAAWASQPDGNEVQLGDTEALPATSIAGTPTEFTYSAGRLGTPPSGTVKVYPRGFLFARSSWSPFADASFASLRFGPGREYHGHNDHQSVTLYGLGHPLLVDSGHWGYTEGAYRDYLRSPQAHNVLAVPGLPFSPSTATTLKRQASAPGFAFAEVTDSAWSAVRTRSVGIDTTLPALVVLDRATARHPTSFEELWHLPPGSKVATYGPGKVVATSSDGAVKTWLVQVALDGRPVPAGSTSVVSGRTAPYQGWVSRRTGERVAAPVAVMRRSGTSAVLLTAVVSAPAAANVAVGAHRLPDGIYSVSIVAGSRTSVLRVSPGGSIGR